MLVGRTQECRVLGGLLSAARAGDGGTLVLRGPPGVGKTALLTWAMANAGEMRVVATTCSADDRHRPLAAVRSVVEPLKDGIADLLPEQQQILAGPLGTHPGFMVDPLGLGAGVLALLASTAERRPLLVVIDDIHWADSSSQKALGFAARRLHGEPILVLAAARDQRLDPLVYRLDTSELQGLAPMDAATLLAGQVDTAVAEALALATDGNPFALLELARQLTLAERWGDAPLPATLPISDSLLGGFVAETDRLGGDQRQVLVLAAADEHLDWPTLQSAAKELGLSPGAVEAVKRSGLVSSATTSGITFGHALLRRAVYEHAPDNERRAAHRALSVVLAADDFDRHAWHLAAAATGSSEEAAAALDQAAEHALTWGDALAAADARARAAELSLGQSQVDRLIAAGSEYVKGGATERAIETFDRALDTTNDHATRADIQCQKVGPFVFCKGPSASTVLQADLAALGDALETVDPGRAAAATAFAALPAFAGGHLEEARDMCRRAVKRTPSHDDPSLLASSVLLTVSELNVGNTAPWRAKLLEQAAMLAGVPPAPGTVSYMGMAALALAWVDEFSMGSRIISAVANAARSATAVGVLPYPLTIRSDLRFRTGQWAASLADAGEAEELARDAQQPIVMAWSFIIRARVEAALGRSDDAHRHGFAALDIGMGVGLLPEWIYGMLGFVDLAAGRLDQAVAHLEIAREIALREGTRLLLANPWPPDLVEAYVRRGQIDNAAEVVSDVMAHGCHTQGELARAVSLRCEGLVADDYCAKFAEALQAHERVPQARFEQARTQVCFGERLRRDRRSAEAAHHLEAASETFTELGAAPWLARATGELSAHGHRRRRQMAREHELTPSEFRVATAVANGATNREAAAELFLSPRTVEHHLASVYRKLGLHSRTELAIRLGNGSDNATQSNAVLG